MKKEKPMKGPKTKTGHHNNQVYWPWCVKFSTTVVTPVGASSSTTSQGFHGEALFWSVYTPTSG